METAKHTKYFSRCLFLMPAQATSQDGNRLAIAYFGLSGLDLLGTLKDFVKTEKDRVQWIDWIHSQQVASGEGFRGSPTFDLGPNPDISDDARRRYDPANLAATFFALCCLGILGDKDVFKRVDRAKIMAYVASCQRPDGSFGGYCADGVIASDYDMRYCYLATSIRRICGRKDLQDIDVAAMVRHIKLGESHQGGLGQGQTKDITEPHSGLTFCGLSALKNTDELKAEEWSTTLSWLAQRQVTENQEEDSNGGFNGRVGKLADTCYSFWVGASLALFGKLDFCDSVLARDYLLNHTQNRIVGGFGKAEGEMPDPLHSYLGIAALSIFGEKGLKEVVPELCLSSEAFDLLRQD